MPDLTFQKDTLLNRKVNMGGSIRINPVAVTVVVILILGLLYLNFGGSQENHEKTVSMRQLLAVCIEAARRGGTEVERIRKQADIGEKSKGQTREGANNPVTDGDMLSHKAMYYGIVKAFPDISVISEEHDKQDVDLSDIAPMTYYDPEVADVVQYDERVPVSDIDIWIDPLDATQEYTEGLLQYVTTMVCVAVKGQPVMGIIHKPFENATAWGWDNPNKYVSKAVKADVEQSNGKNKEMAHSRIIVSRSHSGDVKNVADDKFGPDAQVTPAGGAGYKSWEVIKGTNDVYVHVTLIKKWDICAGDAILRTLGGRLTTLAGEEIDYSGREVYITRHMILKKQ